MRALGFEVKKVDVLKILKDYDREGNGKITFEDFKEVGKLVLILSYCRELMPQMSKNQWMNQTTLYEYILLWLKVLKKVLKKVLNMFTSFHSD